MGSAGGYQARSQNMAGDRDLRDSSLGMHLLSFDRRHACESNDRLDPLKVAWQIRSSWQHAADSRALSAPGQARASAWWQARLQPSLSRPANSCLIYLSLPTSRSDPFTPPRQYDFLPSWHLSVEKAHDLRTTLVIAMLAARKVPFALFSGGFL